MFKDILNPIPVALLLKQRKPGNDHKHSSRGCQFDTHPTGIGLKKGRGQLENVIILRILTKKEKRRSFHLGPF